MIKVLPLGWPVHCIAGEIVKWMSAIHLIFSASGFFSGVSLIGRSFAKCIA
jgi:hypothetical protein